MFIMIFEGFAGKLLQTLKCFLLMKAILSNPEHTTTATSEKELSLLQVNESTTKLKEKYGFNSREIFKRNWQKVFMQMI